MLPAFIGIGVPRGGTTWLHELLDAHPDVTVPQRRKEVHFFDMYYDRGVAWYAAFFPADDQAPQGAVAAEVTPSYLYSDVCPRRIAEMTSVEGLILFLRNPVTRAFSHALLRMRRNGYRGTFEQYLKKDPEVIEWGFYTQKLKNYLQHFPREKILILVHEHAFVEPLVTRRQIAEFIGVDDERFPEGAGTGRVGSTVRPRLRIVYQIVNTLSKKLRDHDLDWITRLGKRLGAKRMLDKPTGPPPILADRTRQELQEVFAGDIQNLEELLAMDLSIWKS